MAEIDELEILIEAEASKAVKELNAMLKSLDKVRSVLSGTTPKKGKDDNFGQDEAKKAKETYEDFTKSLKKIGKLKVDTTDIKEIQKNINKLSTSLGRLQDKNLKNITLGVDQNSKSFKNTIYDIVKTNNELDVYKKKMAEIQAMASMNRPKNFWEDAEKMRLLSEKGYTEEPKVKYEKEENLNEVSSRINPIKPDILTSGNSGGVEGAADFIDRFVKELDGAKEKTLDFSSAVERLKYELRGMQSEGLSFGDKPFDSVYSGLQDALIEEKEQRKYLEELAKISHASLSKEGEAANLTAEEMEDLARMKAKASVSNKELDKRAKETSGSLEKEGRSADSVKNQFKKFGTFVKGFAKAFRGLGSVVNGITKKISSAFRPVVNSIGNATKKLFGFKKEARKGFSMGRMLGTSLLFSSVFRLISGVQQAITEGSDNLAQYSDSYNRSISSIVSALLMLKNAFAAAFAPILNVVAPYLSKFIEMIATAMNAVGQFFAALTGKKYTVQAVKVYKDYAAGLADTSDSADKANDSMKDLKRTIMGFDELNVLNDPNSGSSGGSSKPGSGGVDISPDDMFTTVPIDSAIKDFADRIRKAIKKEDWDGLGKILGQSINKGIAKFDKFIDWNRIGPKITKTVKSFTDTFNSTVDTIEWDKAGKSLGKGINTVVNTLNLLIEGIEWKNLGAKFAKGVNSIFQEANFRNIGNLLGNKFMIIWDWLDGFFNGNENNKGLDYALLGKKFANGINGIFDKVNFTTIAKTLSGALNGIADTIQNFTDKIEWDKISQNIIDGFNTMINETHWEENGKALNNFIQEFLDALLDIAENVEWDELGRNIGKFLAQIDWKTAFEKVYKILKEVIGGLIDGLGETTEGKVLLALAGLKLAFNNSGLILAAGKLVGGILKAFGLLPKGVSDAEKKTTPVLSSLVTKIKSLIGDAGASAASSSGSFSGFWKVLFNSGASIHATETLGLLKGELDGTASKSRDAESGFVAVKNALWKLKDQGAITESQLYAIQQPMDHLANDYAPEFNDAFSKVQDKLKDTGVSSKDFKTALSNSLEQSKFVSKDCTDEISKYIGSVKSSYGDTSTGISTELATMTQNTLNAARSIDDAGGIWQKGLWGWKQITGEEAIRIYDAIERGLYPNDGQGYYKMGNGASVKFGNGMSSGKGTIQRTIDDAFLNSLKSKLPKGYDIAYQNGQYSMTGYGLGISSKKSSIQSSISDALANGSFNSSIREKLRSQASGWAAWTEDGWTNQINREKTNIRQTMERMADDSIINPFKRKLEINSPSRLFGQFAGFVGAGFNNNLNPSFKGTFSFFSNFQNRISSSIGNLGGLGRSIMGGFAKGFSSVHIPMPSISWSSSSVKFGNSSISIPKFKLNWYKNAGFVNGEVWGMNESGNPEMVGKVGHKTAVANNAVITESIKGAVVDGMMEVYMATGGAGGSSEPPIIEFTYNVDSETQYKTVLKGKEKYNRRYSAVATI